MFRIRLVAYFLSLGALCMALPTAAQEPAPVDSPRAPEAAPAPATQPVPCLPSPAPLPASMAPMPPAPPVPSAFNSVPVLFESSPPGAKVILDGERLCRTPCRPRVEPGVHNVTMKLAYHLAKSERVTLAENSAVSFALEKKPYNFFLMNDLSDFGTVLTTAFDPSDTKYRFVSVLDGTHFAGLSRAFDSGISGGIFSYHSSQRGSSWSIFGFGPGLRWLL